MENKKKVLLAASVAGLLAVTAVAAVSNVAYAEVLCDKGSGCAGKGLCGSTKGTNECGGKGAGWVADEAACAKLDGQIMEPPAAA